MKPVRNKFSIALTFPARAAVLRYWWFVFSGIVPAPMKENNR